MISYAQNAEDVVLARLFGGRASGRYVDIGAGDPVEDSVTKHFYDLGWTGLNIEPVPALVERLAAARPRDVNLPAAVSAKPGTAVLHVVPDAWGRTTLDGDLAGRYRDEQDWQVREIEVELVTLADVLAEHPGEIDFLKIDVEGAERDVIEGADWTRHRPRIVVVEATDPGSATPAYESWEPVLTDAGYRCALFDGLNRFYAQTQDEEAFASLKSPASVLDAYERYDMAQLRAALENAQPHRAAEVGYIRRLEEGLREMREAHEKDAIYVKSLEEAVASERRRAMAATRYASALENRVAELETAAVEAMNRAASPGRRQNPDRNAG
ncbi:MAG: FkbM family methyltransferase [Kibdelosporangium sp.]